MSVGLSCRSLQSAGGAPLCRLCSLRADGTRRSRPEVRPCSQPKHTVNWVSSRQWWLQWLPVIQVAQDEISGIGWNRIFISRSLRYLDISKRNFWTNGRSKICAESEAEAVPLQVSLLAGARSNWSGSTTLLGGKKLVNCSRFPRPVCCQAFTVPVLYYIDASFSL